MAHESAHESLSVPFSGSAAEAPDLRCTLEAETPPRGSNNPLPADLAAMLSRARSGRSARTYQAERCPSAVFREDGTLVVGLAVIVWPSRPELRYALRLPPEALPGEVAVYRRARQWKFWADGAGTLQLPWRLEDAVLSWQPGIPCMNARCESIPAPELRHEHARVYVAGDVYGVIVARGAACGFRHEFSLEFGTIDEDGRPVSVEIESVPVSVTWRDGAGEEQEAEVAVPIPDCAQALLKACGDGRAVYRFRVREASRPGGWEIAYSTCDGSILGKRRVGGDHG